MTHYSILRRLCRNAFFAGTGDFWYESGEIGNDTGLAFKAYRITIFSMYIFMTILEIIASTHGDFPETEKSDATTFALSHTMVLIKVISVIYNKDLVRKLNKKMLNICENIEDRSMMKREHTTIKINVILFYIIIYGAAMCFVYEGFRKMLSGSHFVTIVTYWPTYEDDSLLAIIFRIYTTIMLYVMMLTMISIDVLALVHLIMYKYKFMTLRNYFGNLKKDFEKSSKAGHRQIAVDNLTQGVVDGIIMHEELLRLSKDIDQCFSTVYAVQICISCISTVPLLLQLALTSNLTFVIALKIILFVAGLYFLLALFLCNAGEITYQAGLISDAIFYCGWHECTQQSPPRRSLGRLVLNAVTQAQRPLVMKSFKMINLTYETFIMVVKTSYSVFALFYAQSNKA